MDANGNTLTVTPDWANSGTILLGGGSLAGGNLTNNSGATVMEFGAISNAVINSGNVIATNGELRLQSVRPAELARTRRLPARRRQP